MYIHRAIPSIWYLYLLVLYIHTSCTCILPNPMDLTCKYIIHRAPPTKTATGQTHPDKHLLMMYVLFMVINVVSDTSRSKFCISPDMPMVDDLGAPGAYRVGGSVSSLWSDERRVNPRTVFDGGGGEGVELP